MYATTFKFELDLPYIFRLHYSQPATRSSKSTGEFHYTNIDVWRCSDKTPQGIEACLTDQRAGAKPAVYTWNPAFSLLQMWSALNLERNDMFIIIKKSYNDEETKKAIYYFEIKILTGKNAGEDFLSTDFIQSRKGEATSDNPRTPIDAIQDLFEVDEDVERLYNDCIDRAKEILSKKFEGLELNQNVPDVLGVAKTLFYESLKRRIRMT